MIDFFQSIKSILKLDSVCIDNNIFRLHYKFTVSTLIAFSLIVTSKQFIGDPIVCYCDCQLPEKFVETYCWINSTFTVRTTAPRSQMIGWNSIAPDVSSHNYTNGEHDVYHKYYQWVCFVLFFQAMLFYVPRFMWKVWEGGRVKQLVGALNNPIITNRTETNAQKKFLVRYLIRNSRHFNAYAFRYVMCELLNFLNVVGQIYFMDFFLDGQFSTYGSEVLRMSTSINTDPMARIFPKFTKCELYKYGASGSVESRNAFCVLPINVANEKIYVFLWFWFFMLSILSAAQILFRATVMLFPRMRLYLLKARTRLISKNSDIRLIMRKRQFGDWFLLYQLSKNINPQIFTEVLNDLSEALVASLKSSNEI